MIRLYSIGRYTIYYAEELRTELSGFVFWKLISKLIKSNGHTLLVRTIRP